MAAVLALVVGLGTLAACGDGSSGSDRPKATPPAKTLPTTYVPSVKRPNVLVIETDDMRWDDLRCMPNVRRLLQRRGLTFENSFAPYPLCCPSRASFLTGQYAHNHHVYSHEDPYGFAAFHDRRTIATVLQKAGYQTALVGKYLNGYGAAARPRHRQVRRCTTCRRAGTQWYAGSDHLWRPGDPLRGGTYDYFDLTQNVNGQIRSFPGQLLHRRARGPGAARASRGFGTEPDAVVHLVDADRPAPRAPRSSPTTRRRALRQRRRARPVGHAGPAATGCKGRFDDQITHGSGDAADRVRPRRTSATSRATCASCPSSTPAEQAARDRGDPAARGVAVRARRADRPHLCAAPDASGSSRHTVIVFTSDNGYYLGEHRKRTGKINLHEPSLRVPLLIAGPGRAARQALRPGHHDRPGADARGRTPGRGCPARTGSRSSRLDREGRPGLGPRGRHRGDDAGGPVRRARTALGLRHRPEHARAARSARWKSRRYSTGEVELYDLKDRPAGAGEPAGRPVVRRDPAQAPEGLGAVLRLQGRRVRRAAAAGVPRDGGADQGDHATTSTGAPAPTTSTTRCAEGQTAVAVNCPAGWAIDSCACTSWSSRRPLSRVSRSRSNTLDAVRSRATFGSSRRAAGGR